MRWRNRSGRALSLVDQMVHSVGGSDGALSLVDSDYRNIAVHKLMKYLILIQIYFNSPLMEDT